MFVWARRFALKDRVASHRPRILVKAVTIACVAKEVLTEQYGHLNKKEKDKDKSS